MIQFSPQHLKVPREKADHYTFHLEDNVILTFPEGSHKGIGDSSKIQKGMILFVGEQSLDGEGVGFGCIAVEYHDKIVFSTSSQISQVKGDFVRIFTLDSIQKKTWKNRVPIDNTVIKALQDKFSQQYISNKRLRSLFNQIILMQSKLGIQLLYYPINSVGSVQVTYHLSGKVLHIKVDSSNLEDTNYKHLLIFNEQSAHFNLYQDYYRVLRNEEIGVWERVLSPQACLTNNNHRITFCVDTVPGVRLYRGRELLEPRLNWAGFCYALPPDTRKFNYTIEIKR